MAVPADGALLVVDVQNDFCPGGALGVAEGDEVVGRDQPRRAAVRGAGLHPGLAPGATTARSPRTTPAREPFSTVEMPYGPQVLWPAHCVQGTPGAEFHPELETDVADLVLRKGFRTAIDSYSAFFENDRTTPTGLTGYLRERGVGHVWLSGLATDFCVAYSALDAAAAGFAVTLLEDACRPIDLDGSLDWAMREMTARGVGFARAADLAAG